MSKFSNDKILGLHTLRLHARSCYACFVFVLQRLGDKFSSMHAFQYHQIQVEAGWLHQIDQEMASFLLGNPFSLDSTDVSFTLHLMDHGQKHKLVQEQIK